MESYTGAEPSYADLKQGLLYSPADLEAGFKADYASLEEHMCDWIQLYQRWLHDYLAFNLAQISHAKSRPGKQAPTPLERAPAPDKLIAI